MDKRKLGQRRSRYVRSKGVLQEERDRQTGLQTGDVYATSGTREKGRNFMRYEVKRHSGSKTSGILPQEARVHKWLSQITHEEPLPVKASRWSRKENVSRSIDPEGLPRRLNHAEFLQDEEFGTRREHTRTWENPRKHMLGSSSGCSLLERVPASDLHHKELHMNVVERIELREESSKRRELERSTNSEGSVVMLSVTPRQEPYERRRRHKTREDRYEPKMAIADPKPRGNKQKRGEKKEIPKFHRKVGRNGEDIMNRFSSNSIGPDRLTIRPSHTVGLFKNGRASSPGRRRGLPDLTFSEMSFLRRSKQLQPEMEEDKPLSKSREKEKRRSERAQNEISEYFKPSRALCVEVEQAGRQRTSYPSSADHVLRQGFQRDRHHSSCTRSTSHSVGLFDGASLSLDRRATFKTTARKPHSGDQTRQSAVVPDTFENLSKRATSYDTWSDSIRSVITSQNMRKIYSDTSTTPESTRKMLNDTGIYNNSGIDRTVHRSHKKTRRDTVRHKAHAEALRLSRFPPTPDRKSSRMDIQSQQRVDVVGNHISRKSPIHQEVQTRYVDGSPDRRKIRCLPNTIVQRRSAGIASQQNFTAGKIVTNPHLSNTKISHLAASRKVVAHGTHAEQAPKSSPSRVGMDNTDKTTLVTEVAVAGTQIPHQNDSAQLICRTSNVQIAEHTFSPGDAEERLGRAAYKTEIPGANSFADPPFSNGNSPLFRDVAKSDLPSARQEYRMLETGRTQTSSPILEAIADLPVPCQEADGDFDQISGTAFDGPVCPATRGDDFRGLPERGFGPSRAIRPLSAFPAVISPIVVEPLYRRQLEDRTSNKLINQNHKDGYETGLPIHHFDSPFSEYSHVQEGEVYPPFQGQYHMLNSNTNLPEADMLRSNGVDSCEYLLNQEDHSLWELDEANIMLQAASPQHSNEKTHSTGSLNQQRLQVMDAYPDKEDHYHRISRELVQESRLEQCSVEHHNLGRFWQPRRQY